MRDFFLEMGASPRLVPQAIGHYAWGPKDLDYVGLK